MNQMVPTFCFPWKTQWLYLLWLIGAKIQTIFRQLFGRAGLHQNFNLLYIVNNKQVTIKPTSGFVGYADLDGVAISFKY